MDKEKSCKHMKKTMLKGKQNAYLYKRGDTFYIRISKVGKPRLEKSLNTSDIVLARSLRDKEMADYLSLEIKSDQARTVAVDRFTEWVNGPRGWRDTTKNHIKFIWGKHLGPHFGHMHLDEIDAYSWEKYVTKKMLEKPTRRFANEKKYLTAFLRWCQGNGFISTAPKFLFAKEETEGHAYTDEEMSDLFLHSDVELHLQILMGFTMGMRKWEILNLEWWQIDFEAGTIYLPKEKTKTKMPRTFKANDECLRILDARKKSSESAWVWPSPGDLSKSVGRDGNKSSWGTCKAKAGIKGKFHWLRHTFLTRAFKTAKNPLLVCAYAGLSIEVAQKVYLHLNHSDTKDVSDLVFL